MKKRALIYSDHGADVELVSDLERLLAHPQYGYVTARLLAQDLEDLMSLKGQLLIFPGGRDLPYLEKISPRGITAIKDFVAYGGRYVGLCAGAYFGAARLEFDSNLPSEIRGERPLKLYSGTAIGPAFGAGTYDYSSRRGAKAALIELKTGQQGRVYYNGGCYFSEPGAPNERTLARYSEISGNPPAIVSARVGAGAAILCGLHPEFDLDRLSCDPTYGPSLVAALEGSDQARSLVLDILFGAIDVRPLHAGK